MAATNNWLLISERRINSICIGSISERRINSICIGSRTLHVMWSTWATFRLSQQGRNMPLHLGEVLAIEDRLAQPLSWVTSFSLPHDNLGVWERGFGQVVTQLHQLSGPISPTCDRYVQYLLTGTNPSSLTDTGEGYHTENSE
jgi:hypothetical protein